LLSPRRDYTCFGRRTKKVERGRLPWQRENDLLNQITLVMGNRAQLIWDIPAADSLRVLQARIRRFVAEYNQRTGASA